LPYREEVDIGGAQIVHDLRISSRVSPSPTISPDLVNIEASVSFTRDSSAAT
jgi:hypothetical protein